MMKLLLFKISLLLAIAFFCTVGNNGCAQANPTVRIIPMGNNQCVIPDRQFAGIAVKACRGNTVTYEAIGNNITQYRWTVTGGTFTLSAGQDQCVVTWGDGDMGIVDVEAPTTNYSTCWPQSDEVCKDGSVTFATDATTGSIWSITKGGNTEFVSLTPTTT